MFAWLLNVAYLALLAMASPWLIYQALRNGKYREGFGERFFGLAPRRDSDRRCVWLHAVSLGEVNLLQTIVQRIETEHPDWDVVISSTTATGYAQAKKRYGPRPVFYAPLDFSWAVNNVLHRLRPDLLLLAELEVWPNLLAAARRHGVQVAVVNGRLGEKSHRGYRLWRWLLQATFGQIDLVAAQTQEYAERFRQQGCASERVHVTGSLKFDGAQADRSNPATQRLARLAGIDDGDLVFLAGSTQTAEEAVALAVFERYADAYPQLKLILVPRHPERFGEVAELLDRRGIAWQRRSELPEGEAPAEPYRTPRVLLVDAVGELGAWWGLASVAFVGGSLGNRGGQNMIEPAAYGAAVCFGPNTWNFRDVVALLLENDAAAVVRDKAELQQFVGKCLAQPNYREELGRRATSVVQQQQGATELTMRLLRPMMAPPQTVAVRRIDAPRPTGPARTSPAASARRAV
jgi:3-deoxy-D-manno-octulosonic-acid transferase